MTQKFVGEVKLEKSEAGSDVPVKVIMPSDSAIPEKKNWHNHAVWQFNGKSYLPLTQKAEENLESVIVEIQKLGFSRATKLGKRKPTSIRYAVLTTGTEEFYYVK